MSAQLISALLLNFGAVAGASLARAPRYALSQFSYKFGWLLLIVGVPSGFLAIYLFVRTLGWGYGLLLWFGSAGLSQLLLMSLFEGVRTILGIFAVTVGVAIFSYSIM